jgi:hypothetical protein
MDVTSIVTTGLKLIWVLINANILLQHRGASLDGVNSDAAGRRRNVERASTATICSEDRRGIAVCSWLRDGLGDGAVILERTGVSMSSR